jgi:luciferase family oxidoreductase group 1
MKLSIVDLSVVQPGENPSQALQHSLDLAVLAENLGYQRIWFAEHHAKSLVGRTPEVLIAAAAARTTTIRLGSGAVLLNHYSAYRVAETFCTLNELYPGRIDLGVGRATTGPITDLALQQDRKKPFHPDSDVQLTELVNWLQNSFEADSLLGAFPIHSIPSRPQLHVTGTSPWSARAAGERGLRYVFASFFNQFSTRDCVELYRESFRPSTEQMGVESPEVRLGLHVVCSDTELEARRQLGPVQVAYNYLGQGKLQFLEPSPEEAIAMLGGIPVIERYKPGSYRPPRYIAGTFEQVAEQLYSIGRDFMVDEFILQDMTTDWAARRHSYELIAELISPAHSPQPHTQTLTTERQARR